MTLRSYVLDLICPPRSRWKWDNLGVCVFLRERAFFFQSAGKILIKRVFFPASAQIYFTAVRAAALEPFAIYAGGIIYESGYCEAR